MDTISFIKKHYKKHIFNKRGYDDTKPVDPNEMYFEISESFKINKLTERAVELIENNVDNILKSYYYCNTDDKSLLRSIIMHRKVEEF